MGSGGSTEQRAQRVAGRGFSVPPGSVQDSGTARQQQQQQQQQHQQQMRHHKHVYLVLTSSDSVPPIRYLGHPGRGPLMFHTRHFLGDHGPGGGADSVENVEGFQLRASIVTAGREQPPRLVPVAAAAGATTSSAHDGDQWQLHFSVDLVPDVSAVNPVLVEVFAAPMIGFVGHASAGKKGGEKGGGLTGTSAAEELTDLLGGGAFSAVGGGAAAAAAAAAFSATGFRLAPHPPASEHRPISPFNTAGGGNAAAAMWPRAANLGAVRVLARVLTAGGTRVHLKSGPFNAQAVFGVVPQTRRETGRALPVAAAIAVRLSWGAGLNTVLGISPTATEDTLAAASSGPVVAPPAAAVAVGEHQLLCLWDLAAPGGASSASGGAASGASSGAGGGSVGAPAAFGGGGGGAVTLSTTEPTKLKPYASRLLSSEGQCFRVDDVFDLQGDDAPDATPAAVGAAATANGGGGDDEQPDNDAALPSPSKGASPPAGAANIVPAPNDDGGSECVVCLDNKRNALLLPCRHLCLCTDCAPVLRSQSNKCPVCRGAITKVVAV